jgi:hypothetical protein
VYDEVHYRIDASNRLTECNAAFDAFAAANGAAWLTAAAVRGHSLHDYCQGEEVRHLYDVIYARVRRRREPTAVPFRCDSPGLRRFMELSVRPLQGEALELVATTLREEPRESVPLLDPAAPRSGEIVLMCSWCKRVRSGVTWLEAEDAVRALKLFDEPGMPLLSHGICSDCVEIAEAGAPA